MTDTPADWTKTTLGALGVMNKGTGIKRSEVRPSGVPCIRYGELYTEFQNYTATTSSFVDEDVALAAQRIRKGDLLFAGSGETREEIGMCAAYVGDAPAVAGGDIIILRGGSFNPIYLGSLANSEAVASQKARAGQGDAVVHLYARGLSEVEVVLPPRAEQDAIADAIVDADGLVATLERLIAKKQAIKQGMMQQLLTGRTRLPGFSGEWRRARLGDLLSYEQPGRYLVSNTDYTEIGTPVLTAGKTFVLGHTSERFGIFANVPVVIFDDFTTASKFVDFPFKVKSTAMKMLSARPGVNLRYVFERLQLVDFVPVDHKRRWIAEFSKIEIAIPDEDEQDAIAGALTVAEAEIEILAQRLEKAHAVKTGMMQQLLTGRIRLPVETAS